MAPRAPRTPSRPVGTVTRGTTNPNRLRRMDRWLAATHGAALRRSPAPVAVDLGYGASPWTAVELAAAAAYRRAPRARTVGIEIDPARVAAARPYEREGLTFRHGGFEVPVPGGPALIRARTSCGSTTRSRSPPCGSGCARGSPPAGCSSRAPATRSGRRHVWVALGPEGPRTVTFAARLGSLERPSDLAERLPKALIHRNVPGEPVHAFLRDFDRAWAAAAPYASYGARQRWIRAVRDVSADWPVLGGTSRWRQGEVTVRWEALAPRLG